LVVKPETASQGNLDIDRRIILKLIFKKKQEVFHVLQNCNLCRAVVGMVMNTGVP
jgi:hypothetical protein